MELYVSRFLVTLTVLLEIAKIRVLCENVLGNESDDYDFDGLPGSTYEFKIEVPAGVEECFYQKIVAGAKIHVSFEVLSGGDRNIDFYFKDHNYIIIDSHMWKDSGGIEHDIDEQGTYSICLDNTFSHFAYKLVYVYMVVFVQEEWSKYVNEISDVYTLANNYTDLLTNVQVSISELKNYQAASRFSVMKDWYLIKSNNSYVLIWSTAQCVVIIATSLFTVFFVRRLFNISTVTPTSKPRA